MGLYTFLYGNPLYRLYTIHIQPARIVPARLSRYTAHTAHTAYTAIHAIHHTALYSLPLGSRRVGDTRGSGKTEMGRAAPAPPRCQHDRQSL